MKKLNEKQKKIVNIVVTSFQIVVVLIAVILSAIILANPNIGNNEVGKARTKLLPVLTDSMKGPNEDSFEKGDLVVAKRTDNPEDLKIGDIITFTITIDGTEQLNTHRIIDKSEGENVSFQTKGDNNPDADATIVMADEVLAVYKYHINNVGSAIFWLQKPTNFLLVIVLPLIALFIYNIVLFVRMIMQAKISKVKEENGALAIDEDEIKRKAVEEYLAKKGKKEEPEKKEKK